VLTHTSAIGIAGWLPDGQRLLITRLIPGQSREYVEVFDTRTGELQRYGERHSLPGKPVWLAAHQAVAFADVSPEKQVVLRISRGEAAAIETVASGLAGSFLGVSPDGRQVVFFTHAAPNQPETLDLAQRQRATLPVTLPLTSYRISWHPQGHQIAFYNETGFYLADLPSGRVCEVDLGFEESEARYGKRWAFYARWSPDGRYLAALTTVGNPPVHFSDLTLINMTTGERRYLDLGLQYLYAIAWAPNSHDFLVVAKKGIDDSGLVLHGLYIVNAVTGDARQMLADHRFIGTGAWGVAWSSTGQAIALACPVVTPKEHLMTEGRLCIVSVEVKR
jgi:Tol biopolymer transport system component